MRLFLATLGALTSHWRAHPLQAAAALTGLMVATALWSGVQALNGEARASYAEAAALIGAERFDRLEPVAEGRLDAGLYGRLSRAGWAVSPVIEGRVRVGGRAVRVLGIDPLSMPGGAAAEALSAGDAGLAVASGPPWAMLAAPQTLSAIGLAEGERGQTADGRSLPPAIAAESLAPDLLAMDIAAAADLFGPALTALVIDPERPRPDTPWEAIAGTALVLDEAGGDSDLDRLTRSFHLNLTAFGVLAFAVGLFITHAAVGLAQEQRLSLIRTLRACGVPLGAVIGALLTELVIAASLAGALGLVGGAVIAQLLLPDVAATLTGLYGAVVSDSLSLSPVWWATGLAMTLLGALIAAGHTLLRALTMAPLASARPEAWRRAQGRAIAVQLGLAVLALAAGGLAYALGEGLVSGFGIMAGVLLAAALSLPAILAGLLWIAGRLARAPLLQWSVADARQQLSGLSLALMALLLALAANIGVGTMVESFRATFEEWLERRLFADVYIDPAGEAEAAEMGRWLAERPEVAEILSTRRVSVELEGLPVDVVGRPADSAYRAEWPLLSAAPGAWDAVAAGTGAMLSEQLARRLGLGLGDRLALPAPSGLWRLDVVALYADYGNPKGEIGVAKAELERRWPGTRFDGYGLLVPERADIAPLMAAIEARFAPGAERMIDYDGVRAFSLRVFERTFAVTAALNVLTLAVAGVALFASLLTLADLRLPGLAPVWATGVTRARLAGLDIAKTVGLAGLTALVAIPFGLTLAWLLVAVINVEAFGWRLPLHLFPLQWAWLVGLTLLAASIAALWPAVRLARMAPARLVKIFAEAR